MMKKRLVERTTCGIVLLSTSADHKKQFFVIKWNTMEIYENALPNSESCC